MKKQFLFASLTLSALFLQGNLFAQQKNDHTTKARVSADRTDGTNCFQLTDGSNSVYLPATWTGASSASAGILHTGVNCPASVGIGTSTPAASLDVRGTAHFQRLVGIGTFPNPSVSLAIDNSKQVGLCINQNYSSGFGYGLKVVSEQPNTKAIGIFNPTLNTDVFRVMENGKLWCTEVNVYHEGDFPDYVFSESYELRTLKELDQYIASNGHLPNIPSAEEVAENGINVGEMQSKQMEKIEELTLYLIEVDKQLEKLQALNKQLEAKVKALETNR